MIYSSITNCISYVFSGFNKLYVLSPNGNGLVRSMMIALVLSLFILGGIVLIAFALKSFCSVVGLLQDVSVTALSPR